MTEPKDLQEEFVNSFKALMIRYSVEITEEDYIESKDGSETIAISISDLYYLTHDDNGE